MLLRNTSVSPEEGGWCPGGAGHQGHGGPTFDSCLCIDHLSSFGHSFHLGLDCLTPETQDDGTP